jgi:hypothetical protein
MAKSVDSHTQDSLNRHVNPRYKMTLKPSLILTLNHKPLGVLFLVQLGQTQRTKMPKRHIYYFSATTKITR